MRNTWNGSVDRLLATGDDKMDSRDSKKRHDELLKCDHKSVEKSVNITILSIYFWALLVFKA